MADKLEIYKKAQGPIPQRQKTWFLYGAGMENLGKNKQPVDNEVPTPGPDELLVRCDATGLCFSDIKILTQGGEHVRIKPRDLAVNPVVMGHESIVTVVQVGENLKDKFKVGERYVVQADVYVNGKGYAYGYVLTGALTQYETIGQEILHGDDGCYLIPVKEETGYAEAGLSEPWACVVHSYVIEYREQVKPDGICLMVGGEGAEKFVLGTTFAQTRPRKIVAAHLPPPLLAAVKATGSEVVEKEAGACGGIDALVEQHTQGVGFDDIIICGKVKDECLEKLAAKLARAGVLNIVCNQPPGRLVAVDVGRIHYEDWHYVGNPGPDIGASYGRHRRTPELKAGGSAWFLGAGGPMGQMHVQRALEMKNGPSFLVATDIDASRLQELRDRFFPAAKARRRELVVLNPKDFSPEDFEAKLRELTGGRGFDDVVALVPVPALIEQAARHCAPDSMLNIFAGVVRGTQCQMPLGDIYLRNVRWAGSSGSKLADMKETLRLAESGELRTADAVAAIGGMNAVYHGLELVKSQAIPGKIVIFQQIPDLPITPLTELKNVLPTVAAKLRDGKYWTREAEDELLRLKLPDPEALS